MAENVLMTRIQLKYDTLSNWNSSTLILKEGELAIAEVPSTTSSNSGLTPPAIGIKVGNGQDRFLNLPWIQATAGDVHPWAKAANKPVYTANEISGLNEYISGEINDTNTQYQIIMGSGQNANKYYFQRRELNEDWITTATIDFTDLNGRILALETWATTSISLASQIDERVNSALSGIVYTDTAVSHQFVTSVSQNNGIISTTRAQPAMSDISGIANVSQGGTGVNTLTSGEVLIGNGTNNVTTKPIDRTVGTSDNLITSGAVKAYVDSATANATSPMRFIGRATQLITDGSPNDPGIANYTSNSRQPGDIILSYNNTSEFIWTGEYWEEFGNEGNYILHGNVTDEEVAFDAAISPYKIAGISQNDTTLVDELDLKVDKVTGKGLSTNDYTNNEKTKLTNIEAGAQINTIESISLNGTSISPDQNKNVNISIDLGTLGTVQGAQVPGASSGYEDVILNTTTHKLEFARIAKTGNVNDLQQTSGDVLILQCGSSSEII